MTRRDRSQPSLPGVGGAGRAIPARMRRADDRGTAARRALGQVEDVDEPLIALNRTIADGLDYETGKPEPSLFVVATLAGRYVDVYRELWGRHDVGTGDVGIDVELQAVLAEVRDAARSRASDDR